MQSIFNVTSVNPDYSNKCILIQTTFRVDADTVNRKTVQVISASSGITTTYKLSTDNDVIKITLKDWPVISDTYIVKINGIKDMLNRDLVNPISKDIVFDPEVNLKAVITQPLNNEAVTQEHNLINISIKQINPDGTETVMPMPVTVTDNQLPKGNQISGSTEATLEGESDVIYHFEFSSDVAFFDIVKTYDSPYTNGVVELSNGQYYMRARIVHGSMCGDWSDVITFNVIAEPCDECDSILEAAKKEYIDDFVAPVEFFFDSNNELEIVSYSDNGVTYPEFYLELSKDIDDTKLPNTTIAYRRDL